MQTEENLISFNKDDKATIELILKALNDKDYWKAQRLLNSYKKLNNHSLISKIAVELHSKMPGYQNIEEDFLPLLFAREFDFLLLGAKGLIHYFLQEDEEKAKFYANFIKDRLRVSNIKFDIATLEEALSYKFVNNKFSFVEKPREYDKLLKKADIELGNGNLDMCITYANKVLGNGEEAWLARKICAEAYIDKDDIKSAEKELLSVPKEGQDYYYLSLLAQIYYCNKDKKLNGILNKLVTTEIENETQLMIILDTLLSINKYDKAEKIIEKYQDSYEYFCPLYLAKWIISYSKKDIEKTKENLFKCSVLDRRRVVEQELLWCIEDGVKLPSKIAFNKSYPDILINRAKKRIKEITESSPESLQKYSRATLENAFYWVEVFGSAEIAQSYIRQIINCIYGVDIVKANLLSFKTPIWLKCVCICSLIEVGANDVFVWYVADDLVRSCKIVLPDIILKEIYSDGWASDTEFFAKYVHCFGMAFAEMALSTQNFEKRIKEVGEQVYNGIVNYPKNKKVDNNLIIAALIYCSCSDDAKFEFKSKRIKCSKFSTIDNICSEFDLLSSDLKEFIKNVL